MMKIEGVRKQWEKYKYVAAAVLIGVVLLLWPGGESNRQETDLPVPDSTEERDLERDLEEILATMSGVGEVRVLLTKETDGKQELAQDTELAYSGDTRAPDDYSRRSETVLVDADSGDEPVVTTKSYPTYRGALVVCQGGDRADVRLAVINAVSTLTGLSADRITVAKWQ